MGQGSETEDIKPPLGLRPLSCVIEERKKEIISAMERYSKAGYVIPHTWIEELKNHIYG